MASLLISNCLLALLLLAIPCDGRSKFRFAITVNGPKRDFGYTFHQNIARIELQKHLAAKFSNITIEHTFAEVAETYSEDCHPQIEKWAQEGYDLIIGVLGHQWCFARVAAFYPNVSFVSVAGSTDGPPNYANLWMRFYQNTYLAGYIAGLTTKVKKICISAGVRVPAPVMDLSAFCRGVHNADPSVEMHVMETGSIEYPLMERWIVNQSYALGCDLVFIQSMDISATVQADKLGLMSVGFFTDARLTVGESVITSTYFNFTPMYVRAAEAILNGTFATETQKPDWWMGWEWGAMVLADPSFLVTPSVSARVQAQTANLSRVYCGRVCTSAGCLCNASACCVTDDQLNSLVTLPDFVIEHGVMQLPGLACNPGQLGTWHLDTFAMTCSDCPAGTYAYNADEISECRPCPAGTSSPPGATACTACLPGTYSDRPGQGQCGRCPAGTIAANPGATRCNVCPSGLSNSDGTECASASLVWLAGVGGGVAFAFLLVGLWAWRASRNMRKLRKQFSNDNVAVECAAAIARLDLQAVAWLNDIPKPNCIQLSFIRIVKILDEVRKFVPDQLLQALANGGESDTESDAGDEPAPAVEVEKATAQEEPEVSRSLSLPSSQRSLSTRSIGVVRVNAVPRRSTTSGAPCNSSIARMSICSSKGQGQSGLFNVRKVTYLLAHFHMNQHLCPAHQAESNLNAFVKHLVEVVKAQGGTLGSVSFDRAVVHWGTGRRAIAEAPAKAVETALALAHFSGKLTGGAELHLNVAVGSGNVTTGVVETATNHFFMVGGAAVQAAERIVAKDVKSVLGVQVIVTDAVRACVQYSYLCHPRLVDEGGILWEPLARSKEKGEDEWMYQLHQSEEEAATLTPTILLGPFRALLKGEQAKAQTLACAILEQFGKDLRPGDVAALNWVAGHP